MDVSTGLADQFKECLSELDNSMLQKEQLKSGKEEQVPAKLIKYLLHGNYKNILKFLQLLEQTQQSHILNYIISDSGSNVRFLYKIFKNITWTQLYPKTIPHSIASSLIHSWLTPGAR